MKNLFSSFIDFSNQSKRLEKQVKSRKNIVESAKLFLILLFIQQSLFYTEQSSND